MWGRIRDFFGGTRGPRVLIKDLKPGKLQRIEGIATALNEPFTSVFAGQLCASLTVVQKEYETGNEFGNSRGEWRIRNDVDFGQTFYVRDESGIVRVDRRGWSVLRAPSVSAKSVNKELRRKSVDAFKSRFRENVGFELLNQVGLHSDLGGFRQEEFALLEKARVSVWGLVSKTSEPSPHSAGYRDGSTLLEIAPGDAKLRISVLR